MSIIDPRAAGYGSEYISLQAAEVAQLEQEINDAIRKTKNGDVVCVRVERLSSCSDGRENGYSMAAIDETIERCRAAGWSVPSLQDLRDGAVLIRLVPPARPAESTAAATAAREI